ncbi:MAG: DUF3047 domain-containing protein [Piscinibacter sp.]
MALKGRLRAAFFMGASGGRLVPDVPMKRLSFLLFCVLGLMACTTLEPSSSNVPAPAGPWQAWQTFELPGKRHTDYQTRDEGGRSVVHAQADRSASMFRRQVRIEPAQLSRVQFSWRVANLIADADLSDADVSDSPVRLVFAFDGDHAKLSARNRMLFDLAQVLTGEPPPYATLMYVWDNRAGTESVILGPRTDRIRKIVLESGAAHLGQWLHYERDLRADFKRAFGEDPGPLIGVALMTDADNTGSRASGQYGEVRLLARDGTPL